MGSGPLVAHYRDASEKNRVAPKAGGRPDVEGIPGLDAAVGLQAQVDTPYHRA